MTSKYLDLKRIHETSDGDLEFERDLIELYLEDSHNVLEKLARGFQTKDLSAIRQMAHTMKGSSANIGATILENKASKIENSVMESNMDDLITMKNALMTAYSRTKEALAFYLTSLENQLAAQVKSA